MNIIELLKTADPATGDVPSVELHDVLENCVEHPTPRAGRSHRVLATAVAGITLLIGVAVIVARIQATDSPSAASPAMLDGHSYTSVSITSSRSAAAIPSTITLKFDHGTVYVRTRPGCALVGETFTVEGDRLVGTDAVVVVDHAVPVGQPACAPNPISDWVIEMLRAGPVITKDGADGIQIATQTDRVTLSRDT